MLVRLLVYLIVCLSLYLIVCLFDCLHACLFASLSVFLIVKIIFFQLKNLDLFPLIFLNFPNFKFYQLYILLNNCLLFNTRLILFAENKTLNFFFDYDYFFVIFFFFFFFNFQKFLYNFCTMGMCLKLFFVKRFDFH